MKFRLLAICFALLAAYGVTITAHALYTGVLADRTGAVDVRAEPFDFWWNIAIRVVCVAVLIWLTRIWVDLSRGQKK